MKFARSKCQSIEYENRQPLGDILFGPKKRLNQWLAPAMTAAATKLELPF